MVKQLFAAVSLLVASQAFSLDWQRPDCSGFDSFSECRNAERNGYRQQKQQEFREKGLSFWYYERPDFSDNKKIEKALKDKVEGALFFSFNVERDGSVSSVVLKEKTNEEVQVFAAPILAAMKNWQFVPSEQSWPNQEWRFQFYYEAEQCEEGKDDEDKKACMSEEQSAS
ncbi:energy transducer TonB [Microbulbifer sp. SA54]|uniref:energy transducer TonB n=1 Tax=Microbulbifer sp. SA54 TaxID=3401577 RepID=UPI003AAEA68F